MDSPLIYDQYFGKRATTHIARPGSCLAVLRLLAKNSLSIATACLFLLFSGNLQAAGTDFDIDISTRFESNVWDLSEQEISRARNRTNLPDSIESVEDWSIESGLNWVLQPESRPDYTFVTKLYSVNYLNNTRLDYYDLEAAVRKKTGKGKRLWLSFQHSPDQFLGKSEIDGAPVLDLVTKTSAAVKYSTWLNRQDALLVEWRHGIDDYTDTELDAKFDRLRASWLHRIDNDLKVKGSLLYQERRPHNGVTTADDFSSDSVSLRGSVQYRLSKARDFLTGFSHTNKTYNSRDADDDFHYQREDRKTSFFAGIEDQAADNWRFSYKIGFHTKESNTKPETLDYSGWWLSFGVIRAFK